MTSYGVPADAAPAPSSAQLWKTALATARLSPGVRGRYALTIRRFLRFCEIIGAPPSVPLSRQFLKVVPARDTKPTDREALRWYFASSRAAHPSNPGPRRRSGGRRASRFRPAA